MVEKWGGNSGKTVWEEGGTVSVCVGVCTGASDKACIYIYRERERERVGGGLVVTGQRPYLGGDCVVSGLDDFYCFGKSSLCV